MSISSLSWHRKKEGHTARDVRPEESLGEKQRRQKKKKNIAKRKWLRRFSSTDSDSDAEDINGQRDKGRQKKQAYHENIRSSIASKLLFKKLCNLCIIIFESWRWLW